MPTGPPLRMRMRTRDRLNCSEAISGQSPSGICAAKCVITSKNSPFVQYPDYYTGHTICS